MTDITNDPAQDVVSFDALIANCPERDDWRAFGEEAKQAFDSPDTAILGISLSVKLYNLMQANATRLGAKYGRKDFVKLANSVLQAFNVPSGVNANQLIPLVWVMKLDQSTPSTEAGMPRSWTGSTDNPAWFGGNLTMGSLRILAGLIERVSGKGMSSEMDQWDFKAGWESYARDYIKSLRACSLSMSGLKVLIAQRENEVKAAKDRASQSAMTPEAIAASKESDAVMERSNDIKKLDSDLLTAYSFAAKKLGMSSERFKKHLQDKGIVKADAPMPVHTKPDTAELAASMTPGDGKALVESLVKLIASAGNVADRQRAILTVKAIYAASKDAMKKMQESASNAQLARTGS